MNGKILIDTNLWVYLYAKSSQKKHVRVRQVVADHFQAIVISTQILGELYHVLTKKSLTTKEQARTVVLEMMTVFPVLEIDPIQVVQAMDINLKYGYSYWDSLVIATALSRDCSLVYSEDMGHNQMIEGRIRIVNPLVD